MTTFTQEIAYIEKDGQFLFSAEEIGKHLGYSEPSKSVNKLFQRNSFELLGYSRDVKLTSRDGKPRHTRHFTEEGVYILSMLANTEQARDFRRRVADLLKTLRLKQLDEFRAKIRVEERDYYLVCLAREKSKSFENGIAIQRRRDNWRKMEKAVKLLHKGLSLADAAKIIGCRPDTIRERLQRLGVWEKVRNDMQFSKNNPVKDCRASLAMTREEQGSLL